MAAALAAALAAGLGACATGAQKEQSVDGLVQDSALTARVKTAIATDVGAATAAAVNVESSRGVVQLSGFVDSRDQASRAASAAQKVSGVRSVRNDIRVR